MRCVGQGEVLDLGLQAIIEGMSQQYRLWLRIRYDSYLLAAGEFPLSNSQISVIQYLSFALRARMNSVGVDSK